MTCSQREESQARDPPWEVRDEAIQQRYRYVADAIDDTLKQWSDYDGGYETVPPSVTIDEDTLRKTPFWEMVQTAARTPYTDQQTAVAAKVDVTGGPDDSKDVSFEVRKTAVTSLGFGSPFEGDCDIPVHARTQDSTISNAAIHFARNLSKLMARYDRKARDGRAPRRGDAYWDRSEFWPDASTYPPEQVRDHLQDLRGDAAGIATDNHCLLYIQDTLRFYGTLAAVPKAVSQPVGDYLEKRKRPEELVPLHPQLVVEQFKDKSGILNLETDDSSFTRFHADVADGNAADHIQQIAADYNYEVASIRPSPVQDAFARIAFKESTPNDWLVVRMLLEAGVSPAQALDYWGVQLGSAPSGLDQFECWVQARGVSDAAVYQNRSGAREELPPHVLEYVENRAVPGSTPIEFEP